MSRKLYRRAYSMVEILVVLSIIALLIAILLPALSRAREAGRQAQCTSNLREIFLAQQSYEAAYGTFTTPWTTDEPIGWREKLAAFLTISPKSNPGMTVFQCPSVDRQSYETQLALLGAGQIPSSYGLNGSMQFADWAFKQDRMPNPSEIILVGEQPLSVFENAPTSDGFNVWQGHGYTNWFKADNHNAARGYRHAADGSLVAFNDGHVARLAHAELSRSSGHWFWFDALLGDTAVADPDVPAATYAMPQTPSPNPSPAPVSSGDSGPPVGPLSAPCGCPITTP